jgi:hypothetical protein
MIAHVAEAGESRGRVLVQLAASQPNPYAIEAAIWMARAFQSEIESLFIEDEQLLHLASFPFAREISVTGRQSRAICTADIHRDLRFACSQFQSEIARAAQRAEVPVRGTVARGDPVRALAEACTQCGPWNVIALAEQIASPGFPSLEDLFGHVEDATGVIMVGPRVCRMAGPVLIAVEDPEHLSGMLHAADRLADVQKVGIAVAPLAEDEVSLENLEGRLRQLLAERSGIEIMRFSAIRGGLAEVAEHLRRIKAGLIIAQFGGLVVPRHGDLKPLAMALESPLLVVR